MVPEPPQSCNPTLLMPYTTQKRATQKVWQGLYLSSITIYISRLIWVYNLPRLPTFQLLSPTSDRNASWKFSLCPHLHGNEMIQHPYVALLQFIFRFIKNCTLLFAFICITIISKILPLHWYWLWSYNIQQLLAPEYQPINQLQLLSCWWQEWVDASQP